MVKKWVMLIVVLFAIFGFTVPVTFAHANDSEAYSDISEKDGTIQYVLRMNMDQLRIVITPNDPNISNHAKKVINRFLRDSKTDVESYLLSNIKLHADGLPLEGTLTRLQATEVNKKLYAEAILEYPIKQKPEQFILSYNLFFDDLDQWHTNYVTLDLDGKKQNPVLTNDSREIQLGKLSFIHTVKQFLLLGMEHLITGYDHILFLVALLIGATSIKQILKVITAFTAAHTVTLVLATMHIVTLPGRFVESAIALSIAYVALTNLLKQNTKHNAWLAFGFGLIHGFGFADILSEMKMDGGQFASSLLTFNIGIEIGQVLIVLFIYPVIQYIRRIKWSLPAISTTITLFGVVWYIERAFF
ncbi:HupE/UreJ family protein [Bacillus xiapuensis]|uniref:HupE/UreJ family protein n=1 Tax=Bacillus xiapuensis TaxID=2014075 RepID=A0ABU6N5Q2_9BACI|nr:HupE/UreJ family protein [Bacillus xiapuensis]